MSMAAARASPIESARRSTGAGELSAFVQKHPRLFLLSGAGISTESGIPSYRDAEGRWQRSTPVLLQEFLRSDSARRRYWLRSMRGWPTVAGARANRAHAALALLEAAGRVEQLVTQNVDGLHQRAGSVSVIELHGNLHRVVCLGCGSGHSRATIQDILEAQNPELRAEGATAPDGDADIESEGFAAFRVPQCPACGGMLKPDVVFFGEGVPKDRVAAATAALARADAMLVLGSSLMVYSGYRFCEWASQAGRPIAAVNLGQTRADHLLALKVEMRCAEALASLAERLPA
jgi:NAD-dependent SIR2 family protein deacetylase